MTSGAAPAAADATSEPHERAVAAHGQHDGFPVRYAARARPDIAYDRAARCQISRPNPRRRTHPDATDASRSVDVLGRRLRPGRAGARRAVGRHRRVEHRPHDLVASAAPRSSSGSWASQPTTEQHPGRRACARCAIPTIASGWWPDSARRSKAAATPTRSSTGSCGPTAHLRWIFGRGRVDPRRRRQAAALQRRRPRHHRSQGRRRPRWRRRSEELERHEPGARAARARAHRRAGGRGAAPQPRPRAAPPPGAEDGGRGPAHRRHRARLQQPPAGDHGQPRDRHLHHAARASSSPPGEDPRSCSARRSRPRSEPLADREAARAAPARVQPAPAAEPTLLDTTRSSRTWPT